MLIVLLLLLAAFSCIDAQIPCSQLCDYKSKYCVNQSSNALVANCSLPLTCNDLCLSISKYCSNNPNGIAYDVDCYPTTCMEQAVTFADIIKCDYLYPFYLNNTQQSFNLTACQNSPTYAATIVAASYGNFLQDAEINPPNNDICFFYFNPTPDTGLLMEATCSLDFIYPHNSIDESYFGDNMQHLFEKPALPLNDTSKLFTLERPNLTPETIVGLIFAYPAPSIVFEPFTWSSYIDMLNGSVPSFIPHNNTFGLQLECIPTLGSLYIQAFFGSVPDSTGVFHSKYIQSVVVYNAILDSYESPAGVAPGMEDYQRTQVILYNPYLKSGSNHTIDVTKLMTVHNVVFAIVDWAQIFNFTSLFSLPNGPTPFAPNLEYLVISFKAVSQPYQSFNISSIDWAYNFPNLQTIQFDGPISLSGQLNDSFFCSLMFCAFTHYENFQQTAYDTSESEFIDTITSEHGCCGLKPSTPTPTPTPKATSTKTNTNTFTLTSTNTNTLTATSTSTNTDTFTVTSTATSTSTSTNTFTNTATSTATPTPSFCFDQYANLQQLALADPIYQYYFNSSLSPTYINQCKVSESKGATIGYFLLQLGFSRLNGLNESAKLANFPSNVCNQVLTGGTYNGSIQVNCELNKITNETYGIIQPFYSENLSDVFTILYENTLSYSDYYGNIYYRTKLSTAVNNSCNIFELQFIATPISNGWQHNRTYYSQNILPTVMDFSGYSEYVCMNALYSVIIDGGFGYIKGAVNIVSYGSILQRVILKNAQVDDFQNFFGIMYGCNFEEYGEEDCNAYGGILGAKKELILYNCVLTINQYEANPFIDVGLTIQLTVTNFAIYDTINMWSMYTLTVLDEYGTSLMSTNALLESLQLYLSYTCTYETYCPGTTYAFVNFNNTYLSEIYPNLKQLIIDAPFQYTGDLDPSYYCGLETCILSGYEDFGLRDLGGCCTLLPLT